MEQTDNVRNANLTELLKLAEYIPVFPCSQTTKAPLIDKGFKAASQDPETVANWWQKWPDALVAVPMGEPSGLVCIDVDSYKDDAATTEWIQEHTNELQAARIHITRRNGRHYLFKLNGSTISSSSGITIDGHKLTALDVRGEGGYCIWWPMHGLGSSGHAPELPVTLEKQLTTKKEQKVTTDRHVKKLEEKGLLKKELAPLRPDRRQEENHRRAQAGFEAGRRDLHRD